MATFKRRIKMNVDKLKTIVEECQKFASGEKTIGVIQPDQLYAVFCSNLADVISAILEEK